MGQIIDWEGPDLWNLLNLPNYELYRLYGAYMDKHSIRRTANKYRKLHQQGTLDMPEREKPYDAKNEGLEVANRRAKASKSLGGKAIETTVITIPTEHLPYHESLQEALDAEGRLEKATFTAGEHTGFIKNADNEIEYTEPLKSQRAKFEVNFNVEPQWPVPTRVESVKLARRESQVEKPLKSCMIFPDMQLPFVDEKALEIALEVLQEVKPDRVIFLGDMLDLSAWGRFIQQPEWATATQGAINQAHQLLASIRKTLPRAQIQVMEGNHEARMPKNLLTNAMAAYGLKRADQLKGWPVMSVPYLCAFDQLSVEYVPGYPANRIWLNKSLQVRHGTATTKKGGSSRRTNAVEKVSTIFGHDHRLSSFADTVETHEGGQVIFSYGAGTLSRIDGQVPSFYSATDLEGNYVRNIENWQNGFILATYDNEDNFHVEQVPINTFNDYQTLFRGKVYRTGGRS